MRKMALMLGVALVMSAGPTLAQDSKAKDGAKPADQGFTTGEPIAKPVEPSQPAPGKPYVKATYDDWQVHCIPDPKGGKDRCQITQLLHQADGNPIIEVSMSPLAPGQAAVAGAAVITPLETLLIPQLTIKIDDGDAKRYPFAFCNPRGCIARVGFTAPELAALEKGKKAVLTIVSAQNPGKQIDVDMSLKGFSKAYDSLLN